MRDLFLIIIFLFVFTSVLQAHDRQALALLNVQDTFLPQSENLPKREYPFPAGNTEQALAIMDTAMTTQQQHDEAFRMHKLYLAEQHEANEKLEREKLMREKYRRFSVAAAAFIVVVLVLSGFLLYSYLKKRTAHRELVERMRRLSQTLGVPADVDAGTGSKTAPLTVVEKAVNEPDAEHIRRDTSGEQTNEDTSAKLTVHKPARKQPRYESLTKRNADDEAGYNFERELFRRFEQLNDAEKLYLKDKNTLNNVAEKMNINRVYLSQAVNRCANKSFITYMNELRIKDAIQLLSDNTVRRSLRSIALKTGFKDRKTFYSVFKKVTGLPPSEFRGNMHEG